MSVFNYASREFQDWLNGLELERGFSKVLTEKADFRVASQVHTMMDAECLLRQFLVLKEDVSYTVFSFRGMTYLFRGTPVEVEATVRGLPLGRIKLPGRKQLVKSIAEHIMSVVKDVRNSNENWRDRASQARERLEAELAKPSPDQNLVYWLKEAELEKNIIPEPGTPQEIRDYLKGSSRWLHGKARKQLEYYFHRDDVKDDVIQDALNVVLAQDVLMS